MSRLVVKTWRLRKLCARVEKPYLSRVLPRVPVVRLDVVLGTYFLYSDSTRHWYKANR